MLVRGENMIVTYEILKESLTDYKAFSSYPVVSGGNMILFLKVRFPTLIGSDKLFTILFII